MRAKRIFYTRFQNILCVFFQIFRFLVKLTSALRANLKIVLWFMSLVILKWPSISEILNIVEALTASYSAERKRRYFLTGVNEHTVCGCTNIYHCSLVFCRTILQPCTGWLAAQQDQLCMWFEVAQSCLVASSGLFFSNIFLK